MTNEIAPIVQLAVNIGTLAIAAIIAIVTFKQFYTDRLRLKRELFEERFVVYKTAQNYLSEIRGRVRLPDQQLPEYVNALHRSRFLFKEEIYSLLDEIRKDSFRLEATLDEIEEIPPGEDRSELVKTKWEIFNSLVGRLDTLHEPFQKYMHFDI